MYHSENQKIKIFNPPNLGFLSSTGITMAMPSSKLKITLIKYKEKNLPVRRDFRLTDKLFKGVQQPS